MHKENTKARNRLDGEKSPYLRQHAANPVDWYPWGPEASARARDEDKPMLISIGYSTCHWCHVMARESFQNAEIAAAMNESFINIKVDREERPDLDSLYMKAVQSMTGHGGWPLTVFATPEGVPFYGGTYFPPDDRGGMPAFPKVLSAVLRAYRDNKVEITTVTDRIVEALKGRTDQGVELSGGILDDAVETAGQYYDPVSGGFGMGTKFPHAMFLELLLRHHARTGKEEPLNMLKKTLFAMAGGGLYDHLAGGFHRYTVDERWEVPHFEKMLYDNSQLTGLYALAYEATGIESFKEVVTETIEYLLTEMRGPEGGFYSAQDADSAGVEGEYYVWTPEEITEVLGQTDAPGFNEYFSVTTGGNFEGANTLRVSPGAKPPDEPAPAGIKELKKRLLEARRKRTAPATDRKAITGWNALVVTALVEAGRVLDRPDYTEEAGRTARFLLENLKDDDGRLLRYYLDGRAEARAMLEDYALLGSALVSLYEATGEKDWLAEAESLTGPIDTLFLDESTGQYYDTGSDNVDLFVRARDTYDNDVPSGSSATAGFFLKLGRATGDEGLEKKGTAIIATISGIVDEPLYHGAALSTLESVFAEKGVGKP